MISYNNRFVSNTISLSQIDELINFLEREQLFLVPYAIFEIDKIFNSSESFLETSLYLGINSLEQLDSKAIFGRLPM